MRGSPAGSDGSRPGAVELCLLCALALVLFGGTLVPSAHAVPPDPPYEFGPFASPTGPEVTVFDHSVHACQEDDIPDIGARAIKDSLNRTQLIVSHFNTRREIGTTLDNVTHNCTVVLFSDGDPDPFDYNDHEWLHSLYTNDGTTVYGFVHNEYHGWDYYEECSGLVGTPDISKCWYNALTFATSSNRGDAYAQATPPNHLIASVPYQFVPLQGPYGIYRPSNIHLRPDGYYYMLVIAEPHGAQEPGICAVRTKTLSSPTSWRAWDGQAYTVRFINPYVETSADPADHVCKPVSDANVGPLRGLEINSLTYNTYYNKWMIVGQAVKQGIPGFYFTLSDDLIHWAEPIKLMEGELPIVSHICGDPDPVRDGAVLDPSSSGRNFEFVDQTANLYFTRFNYFYGGGGCSMTLDRDLIKYPIQFTGSPPTAAIRINNTLPVDIGDSITFDGSQSTDPGGSIAQYDFDIDGDGTYETLDAGPSRTISFSKVRDGEVGVRVWDNQGLQDEAHIPVKVDAQIDFKPSWAATAGSYAADTGAAWDDTRGYGWVREDSLSNPTHTPLNLSANATDRDPYDKDQYSQAQDTTLFMTYPSNGSNPRLVKTRGAFEIAVPCGIYSVTVSVGDSAWSSMKRKPGDVSYHRINVENENAIEWFAPTDQTKFATATRTVNVCDGRLTIDAKNGINTKLNYVDVRRKDPKIDFQPWWVTPAETPSDYAKDTGLAWDDARGYGWVRQDSLSTPTHTPLSLTANLADRDPYETNGYSQKLDTVMFMQYPTNGSNPRLSKTPGAFEIAVPCGTYSVTVSVGDSAYSSLLRKPGDVSTHRINVEGVNAIAGFVPTDSNKFASATRTVTVCDGRVTIDAIGGTNTKLNYIDITRVS
jgi:hypothetical protein